MAVELPAGQHLGAPDLAVVLRFRDRMALVALASGDIGHVGAAIVEGRVALEGGMRDLMAAATGLLTRGPGRDQHHGWWRWHPAIPAMSGPPSWRAAWRWRAACVT